MKIAVCETGAADWRADLDDQLRAAAATFAEPIDLAFVFVSHDRAGDLAAVAERAAAVAPKARRLGVTGETIIAGSREREGESHIVVWLASLPGCRASVFALDYARGPDGGAFVGWPDGESAWTDADLRCVVLLGDPFSFPADALLERLAEDRPGLPIVGGMGSGAHRPGDVRLLCDGEVLSRGAVILALAGDIRVDAIVSQGCRPIGEPFVVTKAERDLIQELGGRPAYDRLKEIVERLPVRDRRLVRSGVHIGRAVDERRESFRAGDFLIRNVLGVEIESGALRAGDWFRAGQTVQFHVRDADTASQDLRLELARARERHAGPWAGGLLFDCNGRGTRLFREPDYDALAIQETIGPLPLAGFFAQGEIGPVGGRSFLHGFTASAILFNPL